jgi:hypothetical protein
MVHASKRALSSSSRCISCILIMVVTFRGTHGAYGRIDSWTVALAASEDGLSSVLASTREGVGRSRAVRQGCELGRISRASVLMGSLSVSCFDKLRVTAMDRASRLSGRFRWLEPSPRSHSGQSRGGFGEQTHSRAGYFEVVGGCGDRCRGGPDDSDHGGHVVGLD